MESLAASQEARLASNASLLSPAQMWGENGSIGYKCVAGVVFHWGVGLILFHIIINKRQNSFTKYHRLMHVRI
jgi:hypothetical protein